MLKYTLLLTLFALTGWTQEVGRVAPADLSYPQSPENVYIESPFVSRELGGTIKDQDGMGMTDVLVEIISPTNGKRTRAILTTSEGVFSFGRKKSATYTLRISRPGFNTTILKVKITKKRTSKLSIRLHPSA